MSQFNKLEVTEAMAKSLKEWLETQNVTVPVIENDNAPLLICYSLLCELGGPNDELAQFIYDENLCLIPLHFQHAFRPH